LASVVVVVAQACGGSVTADGSGTGGSGGSLADGGKHDAKADGHTGGSGGTGAFGGTGASGGSGGTGGSYVDPGCPDAAPPPTQFDCDPYGANQCPDGEACFPWVDYPTSPCGFETYGASCSPAGTQQQGDPCGNVTPGSIALCAPGFVCVIAGEGDAQCVELCKLQGPNTCPHGLLCLPVDVEGIGGCY
jgi:hypothetical protein